MYFCYFLEDSESQSYLCVYLNRSFSGLLAWIEMTYVQLEEPYVNW